VVDFDEISDRAYVAAGADFAFVLTRRGRLVTRHAPRDMPQEGRSRIVEAALGLGESSQVGLVELPREDLVPYGGAAPVDVYFGATSEAILCVVMPSWADRSNILPALEEGVRALAEGAREEASPARKGPKRSPSRPRMEAQPPSSRRPVTEPHEPPVSTRAVTAYRSAPSAEPIAPPLPPARKRSAVAGLVALADGSPAPSLARSVMLRDLPPPAAASPRPAPSLPDIRIGEATLGRESLAAIERELAGPRSSLPEIRVGAALVGRETLVAIDAEIRQPARPGSMPDAVRLDLVSIGRESLLEIAAEEARQANASPRLSMPLVRPERLTRPWVEAPEDTKRAVEAERRARNALPPDIDLDLIEPDTEVFEAALQDTHAHAHAHAHAHGRHRWPSAGGHDA